MEQGHVGSTFPTLELSYARDVDAPKGVLIDGVRAKLYRAYKIAMETITKEQTLFDEGDRVVLNDATETEYNKICPLRIIATVDTDNLGSSRLLGQLGFVLRGQTDYETLDEVQDHTNLIEKKSLFYELDWNKFMLNTKIKIDTYFKSKMVSTSVK